MPGGSLYQGDDPGALIFGDTGFASGFEAASETVQAFGIEAVEALSHGLRMAAEFSGYLGGSTDVCGSI